MQNKIKYHKKTFENIPEDKQKKVLTVAISHFAKYGYDAANINNIAEDAGISVGSLYNYFASKEDLFLTIVNEGSLLLEQELSKIQEEDNIVTFFEGILRAARNFAVNYHEYNQIYLNFTNQNLSHLSEKLCNKVEYITAEKYKELIRKSKENGYIRADTQEGVLAFCLDNLVMMLQFSYTSSYYKERMKTFLGKDFDSMDEKILDDIVDLVKNGLQ